MAMITQINFVGQVTEVGIDGLIMMMNPQSLSIADYKDLSVIPTDTGLMTESAIYSAGAPIYTLSGEEWVQIDTASVAAGDILLFAFDGAGSLVWVVRVGNKTLPDTPAPSDPTAPTDPSTPDPSAPTDPSVPGDPSAPTDPNQPGGNAPQGGTNIPSGGMPQGGGAGFPSMGGSYAPEESFEVYSLETVTIASVTAQEEATIQITVDELDIAKLFIGQEASVTVNALSGEKFTGTVSAISASGENEGGNSKFTVTVTVGKTADMLPGMSANVSVSIGSTVSGICVPVAALVEKESETIIYTGYDEEKDELVAPVAVTTGVSDGEYVQILSGISEGQTIYYPYYDTLVISNVPEMGGGFPFG